MLPVALKVPVEGLYSSALADTGPPLPNPPSLSPPAIKTRPFVSKVAVNQLRSVLISPVLVNVPVACGSAVTSKKSSGTTMLDFMSHLQNLISRRALQNGLYLVSTV